MGVRLGLSMMVKMSLGIVDSCESTGAKPARGFNRIVPVKPNPCSSVPGGTGHRPVLSGDSPDSRAPDARTTVVHLDRLNRSG